jgi:hypothetical protein
MMAFDDEFERELRQGQHDEWLADLAHELEEYDHDWERCDPDHCRLCKAEQEAEEEDMEIYQTYDVDEGTIERSAEAQQNADDAAEVGYDDRDAAMDKAIINALRLMGVTGKVKDTPDLKRPPKKGQFIIGLGEDESDQVYAVYVDSRKVGGWYFSFRGEYIGQMWAGDKDYYTSSSDDPNGEWHECLHGKRASIARSNS